MYKLEDVPEMKSRPVSPVVVGRGMAGKAIVQSLAIIAETDSELNLLPSRLVQRGEKLDTYIAGNATNVLFVANPSGLHAQFISAGIQAGFSAIAADKPVCVRPEELALLEKIEAPVAVFHGYRVLWGTQTIKRLINSGELGEVFSFESRYWQSSSAKAALTGTPEKRPWKNDPDLNGPWDTLIDLGSHVADVCLYLMSDIPFETRCWTGYRNSSSAHRDTHVHLNMKFKQDRRAFASISKTLHGAANDFEYTIVGTKAAATWRFMRPDEIEFGSGGDKKILSRGGANPSSGTLPFHGLGWLEGYVEITRQTLRQVAGLDFTPVPTLKESLAVMSILLNAKMD
jgi:predicted dehydrogenase